MSWNRPARWAVGQPHRPLKVAIEIGFADRRLVRPQVGDHIIQGPIQGLGQGDDDVQLGTPEPGTSLVGSRPNSESLLLVHPR